MEIYPFPFKMALKPIYLVEDCIMKKTIQTIIFLSTFMMKVFQRPAGESGGTVLIPVFHLLLDKEKS